MNADEFFIHYFERLKGTVPYPWQRKLFAQITSGNWPQIVDMPTGAGKTAVFPIWWLALAWSKKQGTNSVPIRLAWVVNRRVVVDQVTEEVNELRERWCEFGFAELADPPAASTLRGALADNREWLHDPTKPAIIAGTVDMIGSRLLFRGYRSGPYWRPIESGLLGVDTLIVNDEAHLSPAFSELVCALEGMRPAERIRGKAFRYMLLSATQGKHSNALKFEHDPNGDAEQSERFKKTWAAEKSLELREAANGPAMKAEFWRLATQKPAQRVIAFVDSPEDALVFYKRLVGEGFEAELMTGTMRGKERDDLADSKTFRRFLHSDPGQGPVFLVATSAAEVGVNLTCERMVTDLREADHLIQRFGRLNRFGAESNGQPIRGEAYVVYVAPKKDSQERQKATLEYLKSLAGDISPRNLWTKRPPEDAVSEKPKTARLERWRVESWAQTTCPDSDLARVEPWLRGKEDDEPQTEVAWRADLRYFFEWQLPAREIEKWLDAFPVLAREKLQEPTRRVMSKLEEIQGRLNRASDEILIVQRDQSLRRAKISELGQRDIERCLVLLPEHMGRLEEHGMFESEPRKDEGKLKEVATDGDRIRLLYGEGVGSYLGASLRDVEVPEQSRAAIAKFAQDNGFRAPVILKNPNSENAEEMAMLVYLTKRTDQNAEKFKEVPLDTHQQQMGALAYKLAGDAGLVELADCFRQAGLVHDEGKAHDRWQKAMGARNPPAAKTVAAANLGLLNGYRHEFKSLIDAVATNRANDLMLHLIATHHAGGRPFFGVAAYDPLPDKTACAQTAREAEQRFARLQAEFGPWGLAYLEAIFKRADGLASAREGDGASE